MTRYILVSEHPEKLEVRVNHLISDGWEPLGAPFLHRHNSLLIQAMFLPKSTDRKISLEKKKK